MCHHLITKVPLHGGYNDLVVDGVEGMASTVNTETLPASISVSRVLGVRSQNGVSAVSRAIIEVV